MVDVILLDGVRELSFEDTRYMDVYSEADVETRARISFPNPAYDPSAPNGQSLTLPEIEIFVKGFYSERGLLGAVKGHHLVYVQGEPFVPGVQTTRLEDIVTYRRIEGGPLKPKTEVVILDSYPADI